MKRFKLWMNAGFGWCITAVCAAVVLWFLWIAASGYADAWFYSIIFLGFLVVSGIETAKSTRKAWDAMEGFMTERDEKMFTAVAWAFTAMLVVFVLYLAWVAATEDPTYWWFAALVLPAVGVHGIMAYKITRMMGDPRELLPDDAPVGHGWVTGSEIRDVFKPYDEDFLTRWSPENSTLKTEGRWGSKGEWRKTFVSNVRPATVGDLRRVDVRLTEWPDIIAELESESGDQHSHLHHI